MILQNRRLYVLKGLRIMPQKVKTDRRSFLTGTAKAAAALTVLN